MPRTKFGDAMERARARDAALATLPADVRAGVMTLSEAEQDAYLASLGKAAAMEASGETFTPDLSKNEAKVTKAKRKGGRPAAHAPGARTKERPELFNRGLDLEAIGEYPEDEPENTVIYGTSSGIEKRAQPVATVAELQAERDAELEAQRRAELAEALARAGDAGGFEVVSPTFTGQRRLDADPDDPLGIATVETRTYRVVADETEYYLQRLVSTDPSGRKVWEQVGRSFDPSSLAMHFSVSRTVPDPSFHDHIRQLPRARPVRQAFLDGLRTKGSGVGVPKTPEERAARDRLIQEDLERQRASLRARAGGSAKDYRWF